MIEAPDGSVRKALTTPRAAGIAGVLFAVLTTISIVLLRTSLDNPSGPAGTWTASDADQIRWALRLVPYAGIAFLWFIGVVRDRLGDHEDKFFATVFLGSGLVFLGLLFTSSSIAGGLLSAVEAGVDTSTPVMLFARAEMLETANVYALRMAGVFMISLGTVWLRTGLMSRWTVILTYVPALALLVLISFSLWAQLIFPAWTLMVSVIILVRSSKNAMRIDE